MGICLSLTSLISISFQIIKLRYDFLFAPKETTNVTLCLNFVNLIIIFLFVNFVLIIKKENMFDNHALNSLKMKKREKKKKEFET